MDIFIWKLAYMEKYIDYIVSAAKHFNTGEGHFLVFVKIKNFLRYLRFLREKTSNL